MPSTALQIRGLHVYGHSGGGGRLVGPIWKEKLEENRHRGASHKPFGKRIRSDGVTRSNDGSLVGIRFVSKGIRRAFYKVMVPASRTSDDLSFNFVCG
jgi:hypothetical protein